MTREPELSAVPDHVFEWLDEHATASQLATLTAFVVRRLSVLGPEAEWVRPMMARLSAPSDLAAMVDDHLEGLRAALQASHDRVGGEIVRRLAGYDR